jgi:stringent starvation protein B
VAREIVVPISHVVAIYARENGQGMAFPAPAPSTLAAVKPQVVALAQASDEEVDSVSGAASRNPLRSVKNDVTSETKGDEPSGQADDLPEPPTDGPGRPPGRPHLKRVK